MMSFSTREYEIMRFIQNTPYCRYCDVLNSDLDRINETNQLLKHLISAGAVSAGDKIRPETSVVTLTPKGLSALLDYTEHLLAAERRAQLAEQEADSAKRDSRFSKVVSIVSVLIALASLAFSALAFFLR